MRTWAGCLFALCLCLAAERSCLALSLEGSAADATSLVENMKQERRDAKPGMHLYIRQKIMHRLARVQGNFEKGFTRIYQEDPAPVKALEIAEDWRDVRDILRRYARQYTLTYLRVLSHGNQHGMAVLPDTSVDSLEGISENFSGNAEVLLESCNVGRGLLGADYGERLGRTLLGRNGGVVRLPRWFSFAGMTDLTRGSPMGYRTVLVLPGGQVRMSDPIDLESERASLAREIGWLEERLEKKINVLDKARLAKTSGDSSRARGSDCRSGKGDLGRGIGAAGAA